MGTVRITKSTHAALRSLAAECGQSMQAILEKAVEHYRHLSFWAQVDAAAAGLRKDSAAWQQEQAERRAWEATLGDGQEAE
jgi:hypothetical protein